MTSHTRLIVSTSILILMSLSPSTTQAVEVKFVKRDGSPVQWGANAIAFGNPPKVGPTFKVELGGNGTVLAAGLYRVRIAGGKISSPDRQVRVQEGTITIDAALIDESLRCTSGIAWSNGHLYAAEWHANDCSDRYLFKIDRNGALGERFETVLHPTALVVSKGTAYVLGSRELAAFDLAKKQRRWSVDLDLFGGGAQHLTMLEGRLYVTCPERNQLARIDAASGQVLDPFTLPTAPPKTARRGKLPIAATAAGTLLIATADSLIEVSPTGKQIRTVAEVKDPLALAVGPRGEIAVAAAADNGAFFVLRMDAAGKPLLKIMRTTWNDFGKETCDCRYFAGLLGKVSWIGGLAFDDAGNLYVADRNDVPKKDGSFHGLGNDMGRDGGIVKLSPRGEIVARWGSRFTDGSFLESRLAERAQRDPVLRTRSLFTRGDRGTIVVYGDSITQIGGDWNGGASDTKHNWTMLLPGLIAARQPKAKVLIDARGIGGNVVCNGLCRAPQPEPPDMDATLYLLAFGTNDVNRPWMPPDRYAQGLRDFVRVLFVYSDADVALATTGPLPGEHLRNPADYHKAVLSVAAEFKLPVVDMTDAVNRALAGRDYATLHLGNEPGRKKNDPHPNDAGHMVWAQATVAALEKMVMQPLGKGEKLKP